jgi:hypothetical protein
MGPNEIAKEINKLGLAEKLILVEITTLICHTLAGRWLRHTH